VNNVVKMALRNLLRYRRRTALTVFLIVIGTLFVLVFLSVSDSFKAMIVGQITDSMMGHIQIHRRGYVASVDNLPLNLNMPPPKVGMLENILNNDDRIESYSERIKFGGMLSNYAETTTIRLNGIKPAEEFKTVPRLTSRISEGRKELKRGEIFVPVLMARGMGLKIGAPVVVVATNRDGSVNGKQLTVAGVMENVMGPMGRDGYIHFDDAVEILRMDKPEVSEVVIRLKRYDDMNKEEERLNERFAGILNDKGKPFFEIHAWTKLHPFANVAGMLDMMVFFTTLMLVAIVLISILNVMIMAVYERMGEIGTIIAMGTLPEKILQIFVLEGLLMGIGGALLANVLSIVITAIVNHLKITFSFMRIDGIMLSSHIDIVSSLKISALVILISALASLPPAFKAARLDPIKSLRRL
jgi:putative ABC transport system permease protein